MAAMTKSLHYRAPNSTRYDESFPTTNLVSTPRFQPSFSTLYEEVWDELWGWAHGATDSTSSAPEETQYELCESTNASSSYERSLSDDELYWGQLTPNTASEVSSVAQQSVDTIFADRQAWIEADEDIHHFNWMGMRTYTHSSTSPCDSLAKILAKPKNPQGSATWRILSLLNRAGDYIDPVVVLLDDTENALFNLRGSELVRASTGRVFKYYSPHGTWLEDPEDSGEATSTDFGNVQTYGATDLAIGNGFVESSAIRSVSQWAECRNEACDASWGRFPQRVTWVRRPSRLSQCQSISPEIFPHARKLETIEGVEKLPPTITMCGVEAPPEEYFSFPTPVFGRRRGIKQAFSKARQGLESMLKLLRDKFA